MTPTHFVINSNGEHVDGGKFISFKQIANSVKYAQKRQSYTNFEDFVWVYYKSGQEMYQNISECDIFRLFLAVSFCDFHTGYLKLDRYHMNKKKLAEIMKLGNTTFYRWIDKMQENKYLYLDDGSIVANKKFFTRGRMEIRNGYSSTRCFTNTIRKIYFEMELSDHYKMGYVLKCIPHLDPDSNIVLDKFGAPHSARSLARAIGYPDSNASRMLKLITSIDGTLLKRETGELYMNPSLIYAGNQEGDNA